MPEKIVGKRLLLVSILLILTLLIINSFGPMRLTNDTVTYFSMMEKMSGTLASAVCERRQNFSIRLSTISPYVE
jgi:hypothetical protein